MQNVRIFWIITLIIALSFSLNACSPNNVDDVVQEETDQAITFSTYVEGSQESVPTSRATSNSFDGSIKLVHLQNYGFGVYCYYTGNQIYNSTAFSPNFMFNQEVNWDGSKWDYSPLRYWPNDNQNADNAGAHGSVNASYLSFFAYAPYVDFSKKYDEGIKSTTGNSVNGDPLIEYQTTANSQNSVDLLWGVCDGTGNVPTAGGYHQYNDGLPFIDLTKQTTTQHVKFRFKHALSRLTVKAKVADEDNKKIDNNTRILINNITITGNYPRSAQLNLKNTEKNKPLWVNPSYDDRTTKYSDGKYSELFNTWGTGVTTSVANSGSLDSGKRLDGTDDDYNPQKKSGITAYSDYDYVFKATTDKITNEKVRTYYMFIPDPGTTKTVLQVEITYTIITQDDKLILNPEIGGHRYSTQTVTKREVAVVDKFEAGKTYYLNLALGLTNMKFNVTSEEWQDPIIFAPSIKTWDYSQYEDVQF